MFLQVTMTLKLHKAAEGVEGHAGVKLTMLKEMEPCKIFYMNYIRELIDWPVSP